MPQPDQNAPRQITTQRPHSAPSGVATIPIYRVKGSHIAPEPEDDTLALEEPLEIRITSGSGEERRQTSLSVTMRTPGSSESESDFELAAGFLWTEGILSADDQIERIRYSGFPSLDGGHRNIVSVELAPGFSVEMPRLERHVYTSSSCGVCGKTSLEAVQTRSIFSLSETSAGALWDPLTIHRLPETLREAQSVFDRTGGLHAAALFSPSGDLLLVREDVGRHNAVDKLIGAQLRAGSLPLTDRLLLVSGRASFELVQKAMMAGIPVLAAVGAPSSLAVDLARDCGMTLLGFVRNERFNIYTGPERIRVGQPDS